MKPISELAYDSIRAGAPGLSDATCKVIAASIARKALYLQPHPSQQAGTEGPVWLKPLAAALAGYEADWGSPLDDMHEIGRIDESNASPSFRLRVGHIRDILAALTSEVKG